MVASSDPLDQYVVRHPEFFSNATPEQARIAPDQPVILLDHIRCAAFELPFLEGEHFGPVDPSVYLELLAQDGVVHPEGGRWEWIADSYPANAVSLRSVADGNFVVVDRTDGRQVIIAEVDYSSAPLMLYEGAIHMVQSTPYQVERLDWEGRKAYVTRTHVDYYTDAIDYTKLKVLDRFDGCIAGQGTCHHGEVHVVRRVAGYKKIRYYTHENIGYGPVTLPDQEMHTTALWWQLSQTELDARFASRQDALDGFLGAAYALHVVAKVAVMADAADLQKAVGSGDGAWFATADGRGRGQRRAAPRPTGRRRARRPRRRGLGQHERQAVAQRGRQAAAYRGFGDRGVLLVPDHRHGAEVNNACRPRSGALGVGAGVRQRGTACFRARTGRS